METIIHVFERRDGKVVFVAGFRDWSTFQAWADAQGNTIEIRPTKELERFAIMSAITRHAGNISAVTQELGINRATVYRRIAKYGLGRHLIESRPKPSWYTDMKAY